MSQFGMQMPGGRQSRGPVPDVYTALMFVAVVALAAACAVLWINASKVGANGSPFELQEQGRIQLKRPA
ncbi:MAG: hypothetical protein DYG94_06540 [Leptolyngbya sp. PLA3]|nr:MAG: hypothetical protein EDM82_05890 [Cyanobacteria bacterium CYA]MCE7968387.1 hypothetical protein [Leptolyngbya sp. PL-A3]